MAKQGQRAEVNTFVQGLITEASLLNFPPNASRYEENFELYRDGTRKRRKGMNFSVGAVQHQADNLGNINLVPVFNTFVWSTAAGIPNRDLLVVQVGPEIHFFDLKGDVSSFSDGYISTFTLPAGNEDASFASIEGKLLVAVASQSAAVVYSWQEPPTFPAIVQSAVTLKVRDFWGIDTGNGSLENDIYYRPGGLDGLHAYNLQNQSWGLRRKDANGVLSDPINIFSSEYGKYPSNSEVVWTGLQFQAVTSTQTPYERIYPNLYNEVFGLAPLASKGFYVIDALNRGASRTTEFLNNYVRNDSQTYTPSAFFPPADRTPGGASVIESFAGRVFYAGFSGEVVDGDGRSPVMRNFVLFSQLVRNERDIGKCYQEGDPTSREGSDVVDTDGGFIKIAEADIILNLEVIGHNLIVFANNGVWAISGGSDYGFTATNYKVTKITDYGCVAKKSVVVEGNAVFYWGESGIYSITPDQFGNLKATNITRQTIQKLYDGINNKESAVGVYDDINKKIRWLIKEGTVFGTDSVTRELIMDFEIGNFSMNRIMNLSPNKVEVMVPWYFSNKLKFISFIKTGTTFNKFIISEYRDDEFLDWKGQDSVGVDAKAFVQTGPQIVGDSAVIKQAPYIVIHMIRTETTADENGIPLNQSGCLFRSMWDWADSLISNKVGQFQQVYRYRRGLVVAPGDAYDNGFELVSTKNKIRGRGRSIALYMETEPLKDCHILGWNITLNGNQIA